MSSSHDPTLLSGAATEVDGEEAYCSACGKSFPADTTVCPTDGARLVRLAAQRDELIGKQLDNRYEIRAPLGKGGMGTVYRGWQLSVDREVAIKVIHPKLSSDRAIVKRFLREARIASRLSQPNIVNVYDFGQSEQVLYLVMELLRGHTLASELSGGRRINLKRIAVIGMQLCDALEAAHAQGIVHRDLKPGNIMILDDPPGRDLIKVLDFGLAKSVAGEMDGTAVTSTSAIIGTPLYMAPEQIEGKASDQRADLYSLGCILYEMASGAAPFVDAVVSAVLARHIADTPAPLPAHVPAPLRVLIEKLLAKHPDERPRGAGEARRVLESVADAAVVRVGTPIPLLGDAPDTVPDVHGALAETDMALAVHAALAQAAGASGSALTASAASASGAIPVATFVPAATTGSSTEPRAKSPRFAVVAFFAIVPLGVIAFVMFGRGGTARDPDVLPTLPTSNVSSGRPDDPKGASDHLDNLAAGSSGHNFADLPPVDAGMVANMPTDAGSNDTHLAEDHEVTVGHHAGPPPHVTVSPNKRVPPPKNAPHLPKSSPPVQEPPQQQAQQPTSNDPDVDFYKHQPKN